MNDETRIYHMAHASDWQRAQQTGQYGGSPDDVRDGFIHFASAEQLRSTAAKHRAGQRDLLLVAVRASRLGDALRWESSASGKVYPHLYAPLDPTLVESVEPLPVDDRGVHIFPERIP